MVGREDVLTGVDDVNVEADWVTVTVDAGCVITDVDAGSVI